jgi:pimeloyl-ACP methyl ester carboxylesterase
MELAFDRRGAGAPPLVLIHGIGSRRGAWRPVVERLVAERETIALDLPGFGDSPPLSDGVRPTVAALTDAVQAFLERQGLDRPHVAGNSLGGGIALELGRRGVVRSVAALSPIGFWSRTERRYGVVLLRLSRLAAEHAPGAIDRLARSSTGRTIAFGHLMAHPRRRDPRDAALDARALAAALGFWPTLRAIQRHVVAPSDEPQVPVTIGWGTRDRLLIPRQARRARAALPLARHVPLPGCGHVPMSDDPVAVAALLRAASE